MKTLIATALVLTIAAPAAAQVGNVQQFFALGNDSAAERIVRDTTGGNPLEAEAKFALSEDSAAELTILAPRARNSGADVKAIQQYFALDNDSAAERIVK